MSRESMKTVPIDSHGLSLTKEVRSEVADMCTYATAMENKGIEKGIEIGIEIGLKALVQGLKEYIPDFDSLYNAVIRNEDFRNASREDVMKYYQCEKRGL